MEVVNDPEALGMGEEPWLRGRSTQWPGAHTAGAPAECQGLREVVVVRA